MDPYQLLGVQRTQPLEAIESRFRHLVRESHPDVHRARGPAAVTDAERRTRLLTDAMAQIRDDYARAAGAGPSAFGATAVHRQVGVWIEQPAGATSGRTREREPVACPHCGALFVQLPDFERHLLAAHPSTAGTGKARTDKVRRSRRRRRAADTVERAMELLAMLGAVVLIAATFVARNHIDATTYPWAVPVMGVVVVFASLGVLGILFMRK